MSSGAARVIVLGGALWLPSCEPDDPSRALATSSAAITHPVDADGDPAVMAVLSAGQSEPDCTASLIAPRVALTAAHCVRAGESSVLVGPIPASARAIDVVASRVHPSFRSEDHAFDIALLLLAEPVTIAPLGRAASLDGSTLSAGGVVRVVGFGATASDDATSRRKRSGTARIAALGQADFTLIGAPSQPCDGDSGGPVLLDVDGVEAIAGVVTAGDGACSDHARAVRIDTVSDFVATFIASVADGAAAPPTLGAFGARCTSPSECLDGVCVAGTCTQRCFADIADSCPRGLPCEPDPTTPGRDACATASPLADGCTMAGSGGASYGLLGYALVLTASLRARRRARL